MRNHNIYDTHKIYLWMRKRRNGTISLARLVRPRLGDERRNCRPARASSRPRDPPKATMNGNRVRRVGSRQSRRLNLKLKKAGPSSQSVKTELDFQKINLRMRPTNAGTSLLRRCYSVPSGCLTVADIKCDIGATSHRR